MTNMQYISRCFKWKQTANDASEKRSEDIPESASHTPIQRCQRVIQRRSSGLSAPTNDVTAGSRSLLRVKHNDISIQDAATSRIAIVIVVKLFSIFICIPYRLESAKEPAKMIVSVDGNKANEFLNTLKRSKRQLWDRSRPEVQQWYQHFLYMGFDETKYEDDADYWMNQRRAGTEYYGGFHHHHYDEDAPIGPRNPNTFRHGAAVNYDDY
ncbi:unnamed protein product [Ranitomeya imitator]|uniref:Uncharacterized protein n=1 Tax=Ranitomeya imitator TaxID=111125 RepID=A0ABN9KWL6_9NEOB|nr:unnamed protein product [Ranitomeya imitator]